MMYNIGYCDMNANFYQCHYSPVLLIIESATLILLVAWTVIANGLVFVILYKFPRLRTLPNLLVGNLAFSDFCLGLFVLPLSAIYTVLLHWPFNALLCELWLSSDILLSTASIWNLSIIGLDRYWAITRPVQYYAKRNVKTGAIMISVVWSLSMLISVAPFLGWRAISTQGNYWLQNETGLHHCTHFRDLPSFTIYSATGSFTIPLLVMLFVYLRIFTAFKAHKSSIQNLHRQKVIKKHIESTIMQDLSYILPTSDEFARSECLDDDDVEEEDEDCQMIEPERWVIADGV